MTVRVVLDTNTVISGLFWNGTPRQVLDLARSNAIAIYSSRDLLDEFLQVIGRPKFADRLRRFGEISPEEVVNDYRSLVELVEVVPIAPTIVADPDDDRVLECAVAARSNYIISGDRHLLDLQSYQNIEISRLSVRLNLQLYSIRTERVNIETLFADRSIAPRRHSCYRQLRAVSTRSR